MTNITVIVPARMASSRLPRKMLADVAGKPLIVHTVQRALAANAARVVVATDHADIAAATKSYCDVVMTREDHQSGTDRLAEVVDQLGLGANDIVVNVQGDEPLIPSRLIDEVGLLLSEIGGDKVVMATAAKPINDETDLLDPNVVKVITDRRSRALYFSRAPIPYARVARTRQALHHIGIYAYHASFLKVFTQLQVSSLEECESLEQLRALDHGYSIAVHEFDYPCGFGVDTENDLAKVRHIVESAE